MLLGFIVFLEKRGQKGKGVSSNPSVIGQHQQKGTTIKAKAGPSYPTEEEHRAAEQAYWSQQLWLNWLSFTAAAIAAITAVGVLIYTHIAAGEAHEQAVQARRQANAAESQLIATTRAQLKLLNFTGPDDARIGGEIPGLGTVIWFDFNVNYKNFGPSPAENIFFNPHIFVIGAGPSPNKTCEGDKRWAQGFPANVVFPQEKGGAGFGVQVLFKDLQEQAAEVHAVQPSSPIYLGVIGCLVYRSGSKRDIYVTGFNGSLHLASPQYDKPGEYVPLYDVLSKLVGSRPVNVGTKVGMEVKTENAWTN